MDRAAAAAGNQNAFATLSDPAWSTTTMGFINEFAAMVEAKKKLKGKGKGKDKDKEKDKDEH